MCGDDEGRLWTYDLINLQKILHNKPAKPLQPTKVHKLSSASVVNTHIDVFLMVLLLVFRFWTGPARSGRAMVP